MNASKSKSSEGLMLLNDHQVKTAFIFLNIYFFININYYVLLKAYCIIVIYDQ